MKSVSKIKRARKLITDFKYLTYSSENTPFNLENKELQREWIFFNCSPLLQKIIRPRTHLKIKRALSIYHKNLEPTLVKVRLFFDEEMTVKLPEIVSIDLFKYHFFEAGLTNMILKFLKEKMIFVDVGAHFGYFSLLASKIVSNQGFVHSFEPSSDTFDLLSENISQKKNIKINQNAVWSTNTEIEFYQYGEEFSAYNSFTKSRAWKQLKPMEKTKVKTVSLDSYFKNNFPDFVKIDAESAELEVLKGMKKIIEDKHPIITIEVGDINDLPKSRINIEYLLDREYDVFEFKNGKIQPHYMKNVYSYDNLLFKHNFKS